MGIEIKSDRTGVNDMDSNLKDFELEKRESVCERE